MHLWRRRAAPRWWLDHEEDLRARFGNALAVIERPNRTQLQIEIVCGSRALLKEFGGKIEKLRPDWAKRFLRQQKTRPIQVGNRQLLIPAGTAFGTGEHATTAMSLRLLERAIQFWGVHAPRMSANRTDSSRGEPAIAPSRSRTCAKGFDGDTKNSTRWRVRPPELVVDLGTGSGILALAAKSLGAKRVIGIDVDPIAISTARENARRNQIDRVRFQVADVRSWTFPRKIDIVTANLFSELLLEILPKLKRSCWLILSGILRDQESNLLGGLHRHQIKVVEVRQRGKWIAMLTRVG
jgi:ribosomal protein L11 methyltransferase